MQSNIMNTGVHYHTARVSGRATHTIEEKGSQADEKQIKHVSPKTGRRECMYVCVCVDDRVYECE